MNQIQLSDTQSVILSAACARDDGLVFPITANIKGGAVGNVCKSLLTRGLIEEIQASDLNSVWRHDEEQGPITLRATPLAYSILGIIEDAEAAPAHTAPKIERGSKQALLIEMLKRPEGATIQQLVDATEWMPHTIRGSISGALKKKLGLKVVSEKLDGLARIYRIEA